jgi:hypothetical protein
MEPKMLADAFVDELEKIARVPKAVKMYRRAMEMLRKGKHSFHGSAGATLDLARSGHIRASTGVGDSKAQWGRGVYFTEGRPFELYSGATGMSRSGGVALPTEALGKNVSRISGEGRVPPYIIRGGSKPVELSVPTKGKKYLITNENAIKEWEPEVLRDAIEAQKKHRLRPMDHSILELANAKSYPRKEVPTPKVTKELLKRISKGYYWDT